MSDHDAVTVLMTVVGVTFADLWMRGLTAWVNSGSGESMVGKDEVEDNSECVSDGHGYGVVLDNA